MEPDWLMVVSWVALALAFASASAIVADELLLGNRQHMAIMNVVHPITALYWGPVWLWAYVRNGRKAGRKAMQEEAERLVAAGADVPKPSGLRPWHVGNAVSHCGAGCTLGDIGGEWLLFAAFASPKLGITGTYGWEVVVDFVLAWTLGIVFQYFTSGGGIVQAMKVDTLSIVSFQIGLFGWMALAHFVLFQPPLKVDTSGHWFMMQVGMIVGYFTAWPVNRRLVRSGIKEKMDHREHLATMVEELRGDGDAIRDEPTSRERDAAPVSRASSRDRRRERR